MYRGASPRATAILAITKPRKSSQRREPVSAGCSYGSVFLGGLRRPVAGVAGAALPSCCVCWWAVSLLWQSHKAKTPGDTTPRARGRRWHWRSGDRPSYLSGPRRKGSGAATRPGNEVFALLGRTGTGQCLVAATGIALSTAGVFG